MLLDFTVRECFLIFILHFPLLNFLPLLLVPRGSSRQLPSPGVLSRAQGSVGVFIYRAALLPAYFCVCVGPSMHPRCLYLLMLLLECALGTGTACGLEVGGVGEPPTCGVFINPASAGAP